MSGRDRFETGYEEAAATGLGKRAGRPPMLRRPGDGVAVCARCGSVAPPPPEPREATCDRCSPVASPATPVIAAPCAPDPAPPKKAPALLRRVLTDLVAQDAEAGLNAVQGVEGVGTREGARDVLIDYLSGQTLAEIGSERALRPSRIRSLVTWAANEIGGEIRRRKIRESLPNWGEESTLSRLSPRAVNALRAAGMRSDEQIIGRLRGLGEQALLGIDGIGKVTRGEVLEAYAGLY